MPPGLQPQLTSFLTATDLDELADARMEITQISREDADRLADIVGDGTDRQAMANLLMYPEVIPEHVRAATVTDALEREFADYLLLASVVGISRIELDDEARRAIAERLLVIGARANEPLSLLAGRTFGSFAGALECRDVVPRLAGMRPSPRDNFFAGLLNEFGENDLRQAVVWARGLQLMSPYDIEDLERRLHEAAAPGSTAGLPLLAHIPNLSDWPSAD